MEGLLKQAQIASAVRESTMRYASYIDYLEQIKKNGGRPDNYGASIPEEINALSTPEKKAYWLSNDLLGAYDRVSVIGSELRKHVWPFWSWKEVNFKRYIHFIKNAASNPESAARAGLPMLSAQQIPTQFSYLP